MKVLCVLNPQAAGGLAAARWPSVAGLLRSFRLDYRLLDDRTTDIGRQLVACLDQEGPESFSAIAGIGGDGTHSALINALMRYRGAREGVVLPPYAFVPLGTGNDIAKSFGLNCREDLFVNDLRRAVSTIVHGADYWLDLGVLNGTYFADALTIGVDSRILHERNVRRARMQRNPLLRFASRGFFLYTLCTGLLLWKHEPLGVTVTVDGVRWHTGPTINVVVNNTRIYAGEFDFCADAYANDGLLDVVVFTDPADYLRQYLLAIRHNPHKIRRFSERLSRVSSRTQGRHILIEVAKSEAAQLDGEEIAAADRFDISVVPKAIHIKTPAEPA